MRIVHSLGRLIARVRVAPSPTRVVESSRPKPREHQVPAAPARPVLPEQAPPLVQIECEVWAECRSHVQHALQAKVEALAAGQLAAERPQCCARRMQRHDRRMVSWLTWVGLVQVTAWRYRCAVCGAERRPLLEALEVEPGQPSGLLARMLGLFGCVAAYPLAAELVTQVLGLRVNAMTVWRAVQRLGDAAVRHTEALSAYHADTRSPDPEATAAPTAVVVAVDGCTLGMQVRPTRRRCHPLRRGTSAK